MSRSRRVATQLSRTYAGEGDPRQDRDWRILVDKLGKIETRLASLEKRQEAAPVDAKFPLQLNGGKFSLKLASRVTDSTAVTIVGIRDDINQILRALRETVMQ